MKIKALLIANRGEIAVRIIRAAKELGIRTVQIYSDADKDSLAVKMADVAVNVGPPQVANSYLNTEAILAAAKDNDVDAIHPGYGFLAENADFADAIIAKGIAFVGPSGNTIRMMGDKVSARQVAEKAGVPTVPGSPGRIDGVKEALKIVEEIGFPVMIKASAGGGGGGIRIIESMEEFEQQAPQASTEAQAAFGDGGLYIEKFIGHCRHIEVQVLSDGNKAIHLYERECSLQRRRQKVWEEAPAAMLPEKVRAELCNAAVRLTEAVKYSGAGTIEFLYDDVTHDFYFIEMNTRIQVEHPVSELITGIDLIRQMILIASGEKLSISQKNVTSKGHAIEVRINAEDPANNFMPFPGTITGLTIPSGPGIRFDGMIYSGYTIPPFYDSLLGKLIVWDTDRTSAIERLKRALGELEIDGGTKTTVPLYTALVCDPEVCAGKFDTKWLEHWLESNSDQLS